MRSVNPLNVMTNVLARRCTRTLLELPQFKRARNVSIYLSMPSGEIQTGGVIDGAFQAGLRTVYEQLLISGKRVFVPFVDGPVMHMVESPSSADVRTFETNAWGIPEPSSLQGRVDGIDIPGCC